MSVRIGGGSLGTLRRLLGLSGGPQETRIDLGNVSPTMDILPFVRESNHLGVGNGFVALVIENAHAGAGDVVGTLDPYNPSDPSLALDGYPAPVPADRDLWLLDVVVKPAQSDDYAGTWDQVVAWCEFSSLPLISDDAVSVSPVPHVVYASTGTLVGTGISGSPNDPGVMLDEVGRARVPIGQRIPRGTTLKLGSQKTNAGTDVLQCVFWSMLLPSGIGQGGAF